MSSAPGARSCVALSTQQRGLPWQEQAVVGSWPWKCSDQVPLRQPFCVTSVQMAKHVACLAVHGVVLAGESAGVLPACMHADRPDQ